MTPLIIEARVNELAPRKHNPAVPWHPDEIARDALACAAAGASIVHFHGRGPDGAPDNRFEPCRDAILAIRERCDALVHPSLGFATVEADAQTRLTNMRRLAADPRTRPDLAPIDMGSVNVDLFDKTTGRFRTRGQIYLNGTDTLESLATGLDELGIKPAVSLWNVSFTRQMLAFRLSGLLRPPVFASLVMTDAILLAGHPVSPAGLAAHRLFLPDDTDILWAACAIGGDLFPLLDRIIVEGGHVQIGLGDYPYVEQGRPTNADLVSRVAERSRALGRPVATPSQTRAMLNHEPVIQR